MTAGAPLLSFERVSLSYGNFKAVHEASFTLKAGEVLGLCGHNGAGKSSIVRMLSGLHRPDEGKIVLSGTPCIFRSVRDAQQQGVALVDQELSVIPALTVAENLSLGEPGLGLRGTLSREQMRRRLDSVGLDRLDPARYVEDLSIGERQLVEIARAIGRDARLFILDEPTATLNTADIAHVFNAVRKVAAAGCGVIYVSHRLDEVLALCQRVLVMRDGAVIAENDVKDIDAPRLVELMIGHAPAPVHRVAAEVDVRDRVIDIDSLSTGSTVADFNLSVRASTVTAIAGQVGSGGSEILRALAGLASDARGNVIVAGRRVPLGVPRASVRAGIGFLSADRKGDGLFLSRSISENLLATRLAALSPRGFLRYSKMRRTANAIASRVGLDRKRLGEPVRRLSGGNQQKAFLGRCLERDDIRILLLDEPTRGVDVGGRADIHALLRGLAAQGVAVIFASSDLDEVLSLADDVVVMRSGHVVSHVPVAKTDNVRLLSDMTHDTPVRGIA